MHDLGHEVQGSDIEKYVFTEVALKNKGIKILPFNADNIKEGMVVIQGNAFPDTHEEIVKAHDLKLDVIRYHDFLGHVMINIHQLQLQVLTEKRQQLVYYHML